MPVLNWPTETASAASEDTPRFVHAGSNICLDFHGDPGSAQLVVFSDGNHHMALQEALSTFVIHNPAVEDIFYTTTPPRIAIQVLRKGRIDIGNLRLSITPHVFISPPAVMEQLVAEKLLHQHQPFMRSRGVVLLVRKDNPQEIFSLKDLLRKDVKLFLSNPVSEKVSYQIYTDSLRRLAMLDGIKLEFLAHPPGKPNPDKLIYGESIHHREAPQAVLDGRVDVALVFYHLALRYQRIFPDLFDFAWPLGSLGREVCDINFFNYGLVGEGGEWGKSFVEFLKSDVVTEIYTAHGFDRALLCFHRVARHWT